MKIKELVKWCESNDIMFHYWLGKEGYPWGELLAETPDGKVHRRGFSSPQPPTEGFVPSLEVEEFKRELEGLL